MSETTKQKERDRKDRARAKGKVVDIASLTGQPSGKSAWEEVGSLEGASISKLKRELAKKERAKAKKAADKAKAKKKGKTSGRKR